MIYVKKIVRFSFISLIINIANVNYYCAEENHKCYIHLKFSVSAIIAISTIMTINMHNDVLAVTHGQQNGGNIGSDGQQNGGNIGSDGNGFGGHQDRGNNKVTNVPDD